MNGAMRSRLLVVGAALLFSTGGLAIKSIDLAPIQISGLRSAIAAAALLILLREARRGWSVASWAVGAAYAATFTLFVLATRYTTAAHAVFLQCLAPAFVLVLSPWLLRETTGRKDLIFLAVMLIGMMLLLVGSGGSTSTAPRPVLGNTLAITASLTYALGLVGMRWLTLGDPRSSASIESSAVAGNVLAFGLALPFLWPMSLDGQALAAVTYLGVVQVAIAYVLLMRGLKGVRAAEASLLLLAEPVFNPLWVWWWIGERPGAIALLGCATILAATVWYATRRAGR